jgi:hypothetical protein
VRHEDMFAKTKLGIDLSCAFLKRRCLVSFARYGRALEVAIADPVHIKALNVIQRLY